MFMSSKKKMEAQIAEIKKYATVEIPTLLAKNPDCDVKTYFQQGRLVLNLLLIEAMIGAEISKDESKNAKSDYKIKFNRALPTATELADIATVVNTFVNEVENPFLAKFSDDDMGIPSEGSAIRMEKINAKNMKDLIFGSGAMTNRMINSIDCIQLAGIGTELRNKTIRDRILIVGGIALVVTGAGIVGYNMYKKHKDDKAGDTDADAPIVEIGSEDMPEVSLDDGIGDAPVVEID